jgi:hypothetical protein
MKLGTMEFLKNMDSEISTDTAFVSYYMNHMYSKEELIGHSTTGKKAKGGISKPQIDDNKKELLKGIYAT